MTVFQALVTIVVVLLYFAAAIVAILLANTAAQMLSERYTRHVRRTIRDTRDEYGPLRLVSRDELADRRARRQHGDAA